MISHQYLQHELTKLGIRNDAKYTAVLARQLEEIKAQTYDIKIPAFKYQKFLPISQGNPGASSITYRQYQEYGRAAAISNYSDTLPLVDILAEEFTHRYKDFGAAYQYSVQDLRAVAMGVNLPSQQAIAARKSIEAKLDYVAALGEINFGLKGLANNPNVPVAAATNGDWVSGSASPAEIVQDMNVAVSTIVASTLEVELPDTILLPPEEFAYIAQTPIAMDNQTSILKSFLANNPYIQNIDSWHHLATADAAGTGPRMVVYKRDPGVVTYEVSILFEAHPVQEKELAFVVNNTCKTAGVLFYYPLSALYVDGI